VIERRICIFSCRAAAFLRSLDIASLSSCGITTLRSTNDCMTCATSNAERERGRKSEGIRMKRSSERARLYIVIFGGRRSREPYCVVENWMDDGRTRRDSILHRFKMQFGYFSSCSFHPVHNATEKYKCACRISLPYNIPPVAVHGVCFLHVKLWLHACNYICKLELTKWATIVCSALLQN
jgi:hypothetical protein